MPKLITFKAPALDKKGKIVTVEKQGYVVKLYVGNTQEKFVLQIGGIDNKPEFLTHFASGQKVGSLNEVKVRNLVRWGTCSSQLTDRKAAEYLIAEIVDRVGADKVHAKFSAAPIVNP